MFKCKYKFSLEDNSKAAKFVLWSNKQWKVCWILSIVLISIVLMCLFIGNVLDALSGNIDTLGLTLDFILLWVLIFILLIPTIQNSVSKKIYMQSLSDKDLMSVSINEYKCEVEFYKNGEMTNKEVLELTALTSAREDEKDIILVFNKNKFVLIKKDAFVGELDLFRKLISNYLKSDITKI